MIKINNKTNLLDFFKLIVLIINFKKLRNDNNIALKFIINV